MHGIIAHNKPCCDLQILHILKLLPVQACSKLQTSARLETAAKIFGANMFFVPLQAFNFLKDFQSCWKSAEINGEMTSEQGNSPGNSSTANSGVMVKYCDQKVVEAFNFCEFSSGV